MNEEDPRFWVDNNTNQYYSLFSNMEGAGRSPVYGLCDEKEGGYIAYFTDKKKADALCHFLNLCDKAFS
jgi:hypothetical protein